MRICILFSIFMLLFSPVPDVLCQQDSFAKNFQKFQNLAPGVDFFAGGRTEVASFEKPMAEALKKLSTFLGKDLARGAIVVCSTLEQKDSVSEARVLKLGYQWVLIQLTPEASNQQMLAQLKSQTGGQLPPGVLDRLKNQSPEMKSQAERRLVASTLQRAAYAVLSTTLAPDTQFRSSRLDDMGRSPLSDWLDIGLAAYVAGSGSSNLRFLQDRLDEGFPLEDVLSMSRPFVAPSAGGGSMGGQRIIVGPGLGTGPAAGPGPSGPSPPSSSVPVPPSGGDRMTRTMSLPKDLADRLTFDAQAAALFAYVIQKAGEERAKELVEWNREGKAARDFLLRAEVLGTDLEKIEKEWQEWVKQQKSETPGMRIITGSSRPSPP